MALKKIGYRKRKRKISVDNVPIIKTRSSTVNKEYQSLQLDEVVIQIRDVIMRVERKSTQVIPSELSAYIPRVEIRQRRYEKGQLLCEDEMILNSITIVSAPRHPLAGEHPPAEGPESEKGQTQSLKQIIKK